MCNECEPNELTMHAYDDEVAGGGSLRGGCAFNVKNTKLY